MIKVNFMLIVLTLVSCSGDGKVLWQERQDSSNDFSTRIKKITLVRETCNMSTFDVDYYVSDEINRIFLLQVFAYDPGVISLELPDLRVGDNVVEVQVGLNRYSPDSANSEALEFKISQYSSYSEFDGVVHTQKINIDKTWNKKCLNV